MELKKLFYAVVLSVSAFGFAACGTQNNSQKESPKVETLNGTWVVVRRTTTRDAENANINGELYLSKLNVREGVSNPPENITQLKGIFLFSVSEKEICLKIQYQDGLSLEFDKSTYSISGSTLINDTAFLTTPPKHGFFISQSGQNLVLSDGSNSYEFKKLAK